MSLKKEVKNIVFDIGNVILNFKLEEILPKFTDDVKDKKFIIDNIINSPEWLKYSLMDTGYISKKAAISNIKDRTNHKNDNLVTNFLNNCFEYATVNKKVISLIKRLKENGYKIFLLSNINEDTFLYVNKSELFNIVDGYVLSYKEHKIKPYAAIYKTLIERYSLLASKTLFIDDNPKNIQTAKKLGFITAEVLPDDYDSVYEVLKKYL